MYLAKINLESTVNLVRFFFFLNYFLCTVIGAGFTVSNNRKKPEVVVRNK